MANNQIKIRIVENNTEEVKALLKERKKKIFHAWGIKWKEKVTPLVPVDTGRLRQSMHFRTRTNDVAGDEAFWFYCQCGITLLIA